MRKVKKSKSVKREREEKSNRGVRDIPLLIILSFTVIFYSSALLCNFVFDDFSLVKNNPYLTGKKNISDLFIHFFSVYRPIRTISYYLDSLIGGINPFYFHLFNIFYHLIGVILVYLIVLKLFKKKDFALISAGVFAFHPVHVDAVTYISGRRDVLSGIFILLSIYFFIKFKEESKKYFLILVFVSAFLGVFTKEMAFSIPFLIFLVDITFYSKEKGDIFKSFFKTIKNGLTYYLIFFVGGLFYLYKIIFLGNISGRSHYWGGTFLKNVLTISKVFIYYIYLFIFPFNLRGDYYYYTFPITFSLKDILGWVSLFLILSLIFLGFYFYKKEKRELSFVIFFFFLSLLPVSHIIPHHELMAEHYLYISLLSFAIFISYIYEKINKKWFLYALFVIFLIYGIKIYNYSFDYSDEMTFLNYNLRKSPENVRVNMSLGNHYYIEGDYNRAEYFYEKVLKLGPIEDREGVSVSFKEKGKYKMFSNKDFGYFVLASRRLSDIYSKKGEYDRAINVLKSAIRYNLVLDSIYNEIGNNYAFKKDLNRAIEYFKRSISVNPENFWSLNNLGVSYSKLGKYDESLKWFKKALLINGEDAYTNYNVGLILILEKQFREGVFYLKKSLRLKGLSQSDIKKAKMFIKKYEKYS